MLAVDEETLGRVRVSLDGHDTFVVESVQRPSEK